MTLIDTTDHLAEFCDACAAHPYVTVDTEFTRDRTFFPKLCLVQLAYPGSDDAAAAAIDTLSPGLSLDPLYQLFANSSVTKVFHAARQDLEIFYLDRQVFPEPFFDTQIAAMACGFGDQVGYEALVRAISRRSLDKASQFSNWDVRPLTARQVGYALGDVTHLRSIYEHLSHRLLEQGRSRWVHEGFRELLSPDLYCIDPERAWERLKIGNASGRTLAAIRELARFREEVAQRRDIPRNRVFSDKALMETASIRPVTSAELAKSRFLPRHLCRGLVADGILDVVKKVAALPDHALPPRQKPAKPINQNPALLALLRAFLKARADEAAVSTVLIASATDLEDLVVGTPDARVLKGWRYDLFGRDAVRLAKGEIALAVDGSRIRIVESSPAEDVGDPRPRQEPPRFVRRARRDRVG